LELKEYKRQGLERIEQHKESVAQMAIAKDAAEAAKFSAQAVLNSERAWVEIKIGAVQRDPHDEKDHITADLFECSIQIENHGRTIARIESIRIGADTVNEPLPEEPSNFTTRSLHSVLGSGQEEIVGGFHVNNFLEWKSILDGTKRGVTFYPARDYRRLRFPEQLG
jgi:hypothetical protein